MVKDVAENINRAGYYRQDVMGSSLMECLFRYNNEDPWDGLDLWRSWLPDATLRTGMRSIAIGKFGVTPPALMDLYVQTLAKHGVQSFHVMDCLHDLEGMKRMGQTIYDAGCEVSQCLVFGISDVHTDAYYADLVRNMVSWGTTGSIYLGDEVGILTPDRAATLVPALVEAANGTPIEIHAHNTIGLAPQNILEAVKHGVDIVHTACGPMGNGSSLAKTETILENLEWEGHTHEIDKSQLGPIAQHFERIAKQEGYPIGVPAEYRTFNFRHQLPGGMMGTLKAQLAQYGMSDRIDEVLEEVVRVREELGYPIMATPFSQLMGVQAVLNIVGNERYEVIPDEVIVYAYGHLGKTPVLIEPEIMDRIMATPRAVEMRDWKPPELTLSELRDQYGGQHLTDEELISRYLAPMHDIEATAAADAIYEGYRFTDRLTANELFERALRLKRSGYVHIDEPGMSFTLQRDVAMQATTTTGDPS
jgi:oxaloacetate decarboxylase alpha subunit